MGAGSSLPGLKVEQSPECNIKVKNEWRYISSTPIRLLGVHKSSFTYPYLDLPNISFFIFILQLYTDSDKPNVSSI